MIREIITEYYRTTTAFARLQQQVSSSVSTNHNGGPAPMDISAAHKGKGGRGKGHKGYKGKQQGKGYKGKGKGYGYHKGYGEAKGKVKGKQVWQPVKGTGKGQGKNKGANNQGKGTNPVAICSNMLQMWPNRSLGQRLSNSSPQFVGYNVRAAI